MFRTRTK